MNFSIQRFTKGHPYYSEATVTNSDPSRGVVGTFQPIFGQCLDESGEVLCFTMERADTLIRAGVYEYDIYDSPHNKRKVPRLIKDEGGIDISARVLEVHPANFLWELRGCCAPGTVIDLKTSSILNSRIAFNHIIQLAFIDGGGLLLIRTLLLIKSVRKIY